MSNQPPPDDQPDSHRHPDPAAAPPVTPDGTSAPVSGQPWSTPSGDFLSPGPDKPGHPAPTVPAYYPPTSPFPVVPPAIDYAPPGSGTPDYGGYSPPGYPQPSSASPGYPPPGYAQPGYAQPGYAQPGYAQPGYAQPGYAQPGYAQPGYAQPGYLQPGYPPPHPPRKSNVPLIAVIIAVALLLCGGVATAGVMIARTAAQKAREAAGPLTDPGFPTEVPDLPGLPTEVPDQPGLPTDLPTTRGGKQISVTYEVSGDGPAQLIYLEKLGTPPKQLTAETLPWKITTTVSTPALISISAGRLTGGAGTISCRTLVDGKEVARKTSSSAYGDVSCNWFVLQ